MRFVFVFGRLELVGEILESDGLYSTFHDGWMES